MALAGRRSIGRTHRAVQARGLRPRSGGIRAAYQTCLTVACLLIGAGPALTLSCAPWSHLHAWGQAAVSDTLYLIVRGTLVFDERALPVTPWDDQAATPQRTLIDGFLSGEQLGRNGFLRPFQDAVILDVSCYGPWCAGPLSDQIYVAFVELRGDARVIQTNPCGGFLFPATQEIEEELLRCMRGDRCDRPAD